MTHKENLWRWAVAGLLIGSASVAESQTTTSSNAAPAGQVIAPSACRVMDGASDRAPPGGAGMLIAICGAHAVPLGAATKYTTSLNPTSGAVLIVRQRLVERDVLLISLSAGGADVHVDSITRELAKLYGRAPSLGLGDVTVDTTRFAVDGSVGVIVDGAIKRLDLTSYAKRAAATLPSAPAPTAKQTTSE